jgi:phenylalanyl-tRNA synthetase beta chain
LIEAIPLGERATRFEPFSAYPPVEADVSFSHSRERPWGEIEAFVRGANLVNLESFRLLDRYQGEGVLEGAVKTTIRLVFRSPDRTLEQEGVNRAVERLARDLESRFGAKQALS